MRRVGIIGAGTMGGTHAVAWQYTEAQLVGFYDLDPEAAQRAADRFGVPAFPSREALLDQVDIVDVCTPTFAHKEVVVAAARAGKHVLTEKPMSQTVDDCREMIRAADENGVRLFVAQVVRFFPEYATAKRLVEEGSIGDLGVIRLTRGGQNPGAGPRKWFVEEYKSGGVVLDLMVHDFDYARWLAGDVERVFCQRHLGVDSDYALVTLRFRGGAIGHIEGSWAYPSGFRTGFDIAGDDGLLTFDTEKAVPLEVRLKETESTAKGVVVPSSPLFPEDSPYAREIRHFHDCLETGEEFLVTARDGMAAVQIANAARQSALTGKPVTLDPLGL